MKKLSIIFIFHFLCFSYSQSLPTFSDITHHRFFVTPISEYTKNDINESNYQFKFLYNEFKLRSEGIPNYKINTNNIWLSLSFIVDIDQPIFLLIEYNKFDSLDIYLHINNISTQKYKNIHNQTSYFNYPNIRFNANKNDTITIFIHGYRKYGSLNFPIKITTLDTYYQKNLFYQKSISFILGAVALILVCTIIIFYVTKKPIYLYYFFYVLIMLVWRLSDEGYLNDMYFYLLGSRLNYIYLSIYILLGVLFHILFTRKYLLDNYKNKYENVFFNIILTLFILMIFVCIFYIYIGIYPTLITFAYYSIFILCIVELCFLLCINYLKIKNKRFFYYLISCSPLILYLFLKFLEHYNIIPINLYLYNSYLYFLLLEISVLTILLIVGIKKDFDERNRLKEEVIEKEMVLVKEKQKTIQYKEELANEKNRISKDLHDHIGSQLTYILYSLDDILDENAQKRKSIYSTISDTVKNTIANLREIIWIVHNEDISVYDFSDQLKLYSKKLFTHSNINITYTEEIKSDYILSSSIKFNLFRIIQEILNNTLKHSKAHELNIKISKSEKLIIIIKDDGVGFDTNFKYKSYGLKNIINRAKENNFEIELISSPQGTQYTISFRASS